MKPFSRLMPYEEALARICALEPAPPRAPDRVAWDRTLGRILAEPVHGAVAVPGFDRAAMDGFAVRAGDVAGAADSAPVFLRRTTEHFAGDAPGQARLAAGMCAAIATGAPIPPGADCVVPVEHTDAANVDPLPAQIGIRQPSAAGRHVTRRGSDLDAGVLLASAGERVTLATLGMMAAAGVHGLVAVRPAVTVALLTSGDEVIRPGEPAAQIAGGKTFDVNATTLSAMLKACGCDVVLQPPLSDTREAVRRALTPPPGTDLVLSTGGTSVGTRDLMAAVLDEIGEAVVHGVAIKPGRPVLAGTIRTESGRVAYVGLPGFTTSCVISYLALVDPLIRRWTGTPEITHDWLRLTHPVESPQGMTHFIPVRRDRAGWARSTFRDSASITSMAGATDLAVIGAEVTRVAPGEPVEVVPFDQAWTGLHSPGYGM